MFSGVVTGDIHSLIETTNRLSKVTSRQQSEDSIHKQLAAFERLLQHAMSRFSKERLYNFLCQISRHAQSTDAHAHSNRATKVAFKLKSINQLKEIVQSMKISSKGKAAGEDEHLARTFDLFLNDLLYLKDLKKYFDDEIYQSLMKYHFDASIGPDSNLLNSGKTSSKGVFLTRAEENEDEHGVLPDANGGRLRRPSKTQKPSVSSDDERKYQHTVKELQIILDKWEGLLSHDELDLNNFDPDSYHELMQFINYSQFEAVLRLVPDLFAKCYKCIDLSKTWLRQSNIVLKELPISEPETTQTQLEPETRVVDSVPNSEFTEKAEEEFWKEVKSIQVQIQAVTESIVEDEKRLQRYQEEMDALVSREERFNTVASKFEKIDSLITIATGEYQKSKTEQNAVVNKLGSHKKDTPSYDELKSHLKRLDTTVNKNHWKVKQLEFEKSMVTEDYLVELELRPSFILFMGDTKEKILDLERFLEVKRDEKLKLEKQLVLMKTNTERMREIMRSHLGSASSNSSRSMSLSGESSAASSVSGNEVSPGIKTQFVYTRTDGNEADGELTESVEISKSNERKARNQRCKSGVILQKPKLVKKDVRPLSERAPGNVSKPMPNSTARTVRVGPKPALKTTPRRVWENV